ncbi:HAD family hydrolase [Brevundimonas variabilis]|uniref:Beta-phosphoglucomutase-like phosphatase (HAD superfamily) n=1 Tax=Brevundimonas variabilis TaxID=74312 RepID=A0A7W9FFL5_9CAUL|nr:HAD-IA family hydrolase [Brevundimonas variabilis]MBB5747567.1 beta-phosphoglucomutase-like phosphatase (HAD superfamily) [Brevundimonas variabilis]
MSRFAGAIFDVDGVLLASPHERAWREALQGIADPDLFTPELYRSQVAGKPRHDGALAGLLSLGVRDAQGLARVYAARKQARLEVLIKTGTVHAFPDAVRFVLASKARGLLVAAASSSRNATAMMRAIPLERGGTLLDALDVDVSGRDVAHGKPAPDLFLAAAHALGVTPADCFVAEDATAGIRAANAGGMQALGVARFHEASSLEAAGADLVVTSLDEVDLEALGEGRLERRIS